MYWLEDLEKKFWKSIEKETKGLKKAAVLFSGGLDSAIIAKAVSFEIPDTMLFCAGIEGSKDLEIARESAKEMNARLFEAIAGEKEIRAALEQAKKILRPRGLSQPLNLQIGCSEFIAMQAAREQGFETVFMGQGADELFAGYDAFRESVEKKGLKEVNEECLVFFKKAGRIDLKRDRLIAQSLGLDLRLPFCEKEFANAALKVPASEKIRSKDDLVRKHALRKLAERIGVPEISRERPKKAMQYGSGIGKRVQKLL